MSSRRGCAPRQVTLAVNKCENAAVADQQAADFWALGLEPIAVSAISGSGTGDLLDHLTANLPPPREDALQVEADRTMVAVAIVGRPNVGKSSLVNAITGASAPKALDSHAPGAAVQGHRAVAALKQAVIDGRVRCRRGAVHCEQHERDDTRRH